MNYEDLHDRKNSNLKLIDETIILYFNLEYQMLGIIDYPSFNHYNSIANIIFNPLGYSIAQTL